MAVLKAGMRAPAKPNIILINVDQWRGDCLSIDGHPVVETPWLDELALEGVRCARAYAACPVCIPARASLYTGLTPRTHGRVGYRDGVPWDYPVTMAGEFTRGGYQTEAIGKLHVYPERHRLGFEHVVLHDGYLHFARDRRRDQVVRDDYLLWLRRQEGVGADYVEHGLDCNAQVARPWDKAERLHPTNWAFGEAVDFLRRRDATKPFFLYLSLHRPHPPYDPPRWAFDQYMEDPMPDPPQGDWGDAFAPYTNSRKPDLFVGRMDPRALRRARAGYYGLMTQIDHQVHRLREAVQEHGLHGSTYFCFLSDHGEMLGDHGLFRKGYPYEGSARVPLILRGPAGSGLQANHVITEPVELRDVMPTLLEVAGLPIPKSVEGKSFLPLATGKKIRWRPWLHGELALFGQSLQWLTDGHEKYVWFSGTGREQLFNLDDDPEERRDLARNGGAGPAVARWRARLVGELRGREEGFVSGSRLVRGRPVHAVLSHLARRVGLADR